MITQYRDRALRHKENKYFGRNKYWNVGIGHCGIRRTNALRWDKACNYYLSSIFLFLTKLGQGFRIKVHQTCHYVSLLLYILELLKQILKQNILLYILKLQTAETNIETKYIATYFGRKKKEKAIDAVSYGVYR